MRIGSGFLGNTTRISFLFALAVIFTSSLGLASAGADEIGWEFADSGLTQSAFHEIAPHAALHTEIHAGPGNSMARDTLDLEAHGGYTNEYVFGMTKAVMRSTLAPAVKPLALIFTVPLDLVTVPFAIVGGFMR